MRVLRAAVAAVLMLLPALSGAAVQDPTDGFVPVDPSVDIVESLPAAPMVMGAYALVWLILIGYIWSLRRRQARIELELASLRTRVAGDKDGRR